MSLSPDRQPPKVLVVDDAITIPDEAFIAESKRVLNERGITFIECPNCGKHAAPSVIVGSSPGYSCEHCKTWGTLEKWPDKPQPHVNVGLIGLGKRSVMPVAALLGMMGAFASVDMLPRRYRPKPELEEKPLTSADHDRIAAAKAKRARKAARKS